MQTHIVTVDSLYKHIMYTYITHTFTTSFTESLTEVSEVEAASFNCDICSIISASGASVSPAAGSVNSLHTDPQTVQQ